MKTTIIAAALTLFAGQAAASEMFCVLQDTKGNTTGYHLADYKGAVFQEISVEKNGRKLVHDDDARPLWKSSVEGEIMVMVYQPDPTYMIGVGGDPEIEDGIKMRKAVLMKGKNPIAKGACGMKADEPSRPAGTTGGRRVQSF